MTVTAQSARRPIFTALAAHLRTIPGLAVYDTGEISTEPAKLDGGPVGRIAPYAVPYADPGQLDPNPSIEAVPADFVWSGQVTFAAGLQNDLLALLDLAIPALSLWSPSIDGLSCGLLRPPDGFSARVRRIDTVRPPRWEAATLWRLHVVTATAV